MNLVSSLCLYCVAYVTCQEDIDVMKTSNVRFPEDSVYAARLNASHSEKIAEFTICYRFFIESYNDGFIYLLRMRTSDWSDSYYYDGIFWDAGDEREGFQGGRSFIKRNVEGGGLINMQYPRYASYVLPKNIDVSKWIHFCSSYSSSLRRLIRYQNGQKVMGFTFKDKKENPLPQDIFEITQIGRNFRGLLTDLNIYSTFMDDKDLIKWTTGCEPSGGDIFDWDISKIKPLERITEMIKMDKNDICPDAAKPEPVQRPKTATRKAKNRRFKPYLAIGESFAGMVLEMVTGPEHKSYEEVEDTCFRVGGDLIMFPQTEEEMNLMDGVVWDLIMQRADNNQSVIDDYYNKYLWASGAWYKVPVGGITAEIDEEIVKKQKGESYDPRELTYPNKGEVDLFHPWTGKKLYPYGRGTIMRPLQSANYKYPRIRYECLHSLREKKPGSYWHDRLTPLCFEGSIEAKGSGNPICAFPKNPTFRKVPINIKSIIWIRAIHQYWKAYFSDPANLATFSDMQRNSQSLILMLFN